MQSVRTRVGAIVQLKTLTDKKTVCHDYKRKAAEFHPYNNNLIGFIHLLSLLVLPK